MRRSLAVSVLAASIVGLSGSPAHAGDDPPEGSGEWPEGSGEWVPLPPEYYEQELTFQACDGETFTLTAGDVRGASTRETELKGDRILSEYRGPETVDIVRESDGATIDELDVGGYARTLITPLEDGNEHVVDQLFGASIILPLTEEESEQIEDFFGTDLVWWGDEEEHITLEAILDPETFEYVEIIDVTIEADWVDLCKAFDDPDLLDDDDDDDDDGDDDDDDDEDDHEDDHDHDHDDGDDRH